MEDVLISLSLSFSFAIIFSIVPIIIHKQYAACYAVLLMMLKVVLFPVSIIKADSV